jgi:hypothetical protein
MIVKGHTLRRLGRAIRKTTSGRTTLGELLRGLPEAPVVLAERARRKAEAAAAAGKAALPPQPAVATTPPAEARPADPPPPAPGMPPPEPKWYEEMCRWRQHEAADSYDHEVRYETIHEYDPLERALEEDYNWDS